MGRRFGLLVNPNGCMGLKPAFFARMGINMTTSVEYFAGIDVSKQQLDMAIIPGAQTISGRMMPRA